MKKVGIYALGLSMMTALSAQAAGVYVRDIAVKGLKRVEVD